MKRAVHDPEAFLPLTAAESYILLALAEGERHGYAIMRALSMHNQVKIHLGPATLYRSIKQLLDEDIIREVGERRDPAVDNERRRYYDLTDFGIQVLNAEKQRQLSWVTLTQNALNRRMATIDELQAWDQPEPDTLEMYDS